MRTKVEIVTELRTMLRDVFVAKSAGETYSRLARAHGYVDGYMRALLETDVVSKDELLAIVASEREQVSGPAIRSVSDVGRAGAESDSDTGGLRGLSARARGSDSD